MAKLQRTAFILDLPVVYRKDTQAEIVRVNIVCMRGDMTAQHYALRGEVVIRGGYWYVYPRVTDVDTSGITIYTDRGPSHADEGMMRVDNQVMRTIKPHSRFSAEVLEGLFLFKYIGKEALKLSRAYLSDQFDAQRREQAQEEAVSQIEDLLFGGVLDAKAIRSVVSTYEKRRKECEALAALAKKTEAEASEHADDVKADLEGW